MLTTKELILVIILVCFIVSFMGAIIKKSIALIATLGLIGVISFVGLKWLPNQVESVVTGEKTVTEISEEVRNEYNSTGIPKMIDAADEYVEKNSETWIDAINSLTEKATTFLKDEKITER